MSFLNGSNLQDTLVPVDPVLPVRQISFRCGALRASVSSNDRPLPRRAPAHQETSKTSFRAQPVDPVVDHEDHSKIWR
jgi:hypothetical protein